jgi:hypothetical protein
MGKFNERAAMRMISEDQREALTEQSDVER